MVWYAKLPVWVVILVTVCVVIEAAITVTPFFGFAAARPAALLVAGFWSALIRDGTGIYPGQPVLMFLSYGLLHGGAVHLAMNMLSLVAIARQLMLLVRPGTMAVIYLICQIAAAGTYAIMQPAGGPMVGASGAIFGLAGALIALAARYRMGRGLPMAPIIKSVALIAGLNIGLTLLVPAIAWQAHLGGIVAGLLIGLLIRGR